MEHKHGIRPMVIHYGAMVDILCRAEHLKEAYNFIVNVPFQLDPFLWRTLLSARSIHNVSDNDGLVDKVRKKLLELQPRRIGNFVMVVNMYADARMWEKAANVWRTMRDGGLKKMGEESCIALEGESISSFLAVAHKMIHKHGSTIEAVILKKAPTSDIRSPKKGREREGYIDIADHKSSTDEEAKWPFIAVQWKPTFRNIHYWSNHQRVFGYWIDQRCVYCQS
ncbi:unnamed protein product [Dovyalis caffra]|uniref:Pentatricopeptide repeat-containing protein n=1 Tax=Dovyalis caffra TaxID=77055 RepID=A0AAV1R6M4_9ROSI|nr:unnamed protein product [Dovyalis caffra]